MPLAQAPRNPICSARECTAPADYAVIWHNPRLHTGRSKTWLACVGHLDFLRNYLRDRGFPFRVEDFTPEDADASPEDSHER